MSSAYNLQLVHTREGSGNGEGVSCDFYFITDVAPLYQSERTSVTGSDEVEHVPS